MPRKALNAEDIREKEDKNKDKKANTSKEKASSKKKETKPKVATKTEVIVGDEKKKEKKASVKKPVAKKATAKKVDTKKADAKKADTKKASTKKADAKKVDTKKADTKKASTKKVDAKKAGTKKVDAKKATAKKAGTKKASTKKASTKKVGTKKVGTKKLETTKKTSTKKKKTEDPVVDKIKDFLTKITLIQEDESETKTTKKRAKNNSAMHIKDTTAEGETETSTPKKGKKKTEYILEYYDLPYRYNETVVRILAQTPKKLFVYWDISDNDREKYTKVFGETFFYETYPVLLLHNEDYNYTTEIPINDFANSWYIEINDAKSKYTIQLGRKFKNKPYIANSDIMNEHNVILENDYLPIVDSNKLESPNDHILFEKFKSIIKFRNIKTYEENNKKLNSNDFKNKVGKIYNIYDIYAELYNEEIEEGVFDMTNPTSAELGKVKMAGSSFFK